VLEALKVPERVGEKVGLSVPLLLKEGLGVEEEDTLCVIVAARDMVALRGVGDTVKVALPPVPDPLKDPVWVGENVLEPVPLPLLLGQDEGEEDTLCVLVMQGELEEEREREMRPLAEGEGVMEPV